MSFEPEHTRATRITDGWRGPRRHVEEIILLGAASTAFLFTLAIALGLIVA